MTGGFGGTRPDLGPEMWGTYDPLLVVLSIGVACLAGYSALAVVDRIRAAPTARVRGGWVTAGGVAMGSGIWAMHFTGMTAFSMDVPVTYGLYPTLASVVPAILASAAALHCLSQPSIGWGRLQLGAGLMAAGIGTMHYTGMAAMRMPAVLVYTPSLFVLSLVVAHVLATAALYIKFILGRRGWAGAAWARLASAVVMGHAVAGMHYTAMAAARFFHDPALTIAGTVFSPLALGVAICGATSLIMGVAIVGTIVDRHLEEAAVRLRDTEAWADAVINTVTDGIIAIDQGGIIRSFNRAAARIFGYEGAEVIGRNVEMLMPATSHDAHPMRPRAPRAPAIVGTYREVVARRRDGSTFPLELGISELWYEEVPMFLATIRDITTRKALESQLAQAQKLESIGQLAAGVAHEINTPIQFIGDNARFLEDAFDELKGVLDAGRALAEAGAGADQTAMLAARVRAAIDQVDVAYLGEEIPKAIRQSLEGVDSVARIVAAMKELSHPGSTEKHPIDLNRAIDGAVTVSRNEWRYVADLETDLDPRLPPVPCVAGELSQVLLNVIVNAAHAIAAANVADPAVRGKITITTRGDGDWAEVRVADTGTGIPESIRSRIFDPFFTTKEVGKGTGQGLAIAHAVVNDKHHGTIRVESTAGRGSTFIIRLPLVAGEHASAPL